MTVTPQIMSDPPGAPHEQDRGRAVSLVRPDPLIAQPLILSSPHSGRDYARELCDQTPVPVEQLRRSEDAYVDVLIEGAAAYGASLVCAHFPRVFVDVNRARGELDPAMYRDRMDVCADPPSRRVASGLGVIPRVGSQGQQLYRRRLHFKDAQDRLSRFYEPYHDGLAGLIAEVRDRFGFAIVMDMHSMPEHSAPGVDFVLGDRHGQSCDPRITAAVEAGLRARGFVTVRNTPYAGGHTTEYYGKPATGIHVIQIEINRGLYLHETRVVPNAKFDIFRENLQQFIREFAARSWSGFTPS
ncbi:N-formylglutamate amidohydrolase [Maricaulis salignorans]|uniref:N-formylglutamate amidohydrolase n=1 Tax=Maricaulis salignorans TaxID=144026 RepID=UPI003A8E0FB0